MVDPSEQVDAAKASIVFDTESPVNPPSIPLRVLVSSHKPRPPWLIHPNKLSPLEHPALTSLCPQVIVVSIPLQVIFWSHEP